MFVQAFAECKILPMSMPLSYCKSFSAQNCERTDFLSLLCMLSEKCSKLFPFHGPGSSQERQEESFSASASNFTAAL
jgi:hypothetical protein